jgi:hypothetical protein
VGERGYHVLKMREKIILGLVDERVSHILKIRTKIILGLVDERQNRAGVYIMQARDFPCIARCSDK